MKAAATAPSILQLPALIDCHVHFREPGYAHKGDMASESAAALSGGVDVVCDMPNTSPPTQTIETLADKVRRAKEHCACRIFFFFGATAMNHLEELEQLWTKPELAELKAHCCGLKLYLDNSTGNLKSSQRVTEAAFQLCGKLDIPLVAHCEHAEVNDAAASQHPYTGPASHSVRRPPESEVESIQRVLQLASQYDTPVHIAHLSTAGGLEAIHKAREADPSLPLTCEVSPHHLFLTTEDYKTSMARVKVNPPIRASEDAEALWEGLLNGWVDCVATDHAPHTLIEKTDVSEGSQPPSGMPSVEVVVPLLLTVMSGAWPHPSMAKPKALATRRLTAELLKRVMHDNPNKIFRLGVADTPLRRFDLREEWVVEEDKLHSRCGWSPYNGWKLCGKLISS